MVLSAAVGYTDALVKDVVINGDPAANYRAPLTPKVHVTLFGSYMWPLAGGALSLEANAQYQSLSYLGLANYEADQIPSYWVAGARLSWSDTSGRWAFALSGDNLADTRYKTVGFDVATFGFEQYAIGQPRWIKFNISRHF